MNVHQIRGRRIHHALMMLINVPVDVTKAVNLRKAICKLHITIFLDC